MSSRNLVFVGFRHPRLLQKLRNLRVGFCQVLFLDVFGDSTGRSRAEAWIHDTSGDSLKISQDASNITGGQVGILIKKVTTIARCPPDYAAWCYSRQSSEEFKLLNFWPSPKPWMRQRCRMTWSRERCSSSLELKRRTRNRTKRLALPASAAAGSVLLGPLIVLKKALWWSLWLRTGPDCSSTESSFAVDHGTAGSPDNFFGAPCPEQLSSSWAAAEQQIACSISILCSELSELCTMCSSLAKINNIIWAFHDGFRSCKKSPNARHPIKLCTDPEIENKVVTFELEQ